MKTIKITKRLREQAALVCDVEASTTNLYGESDEVAKLLGFPRNAGRLAFAAVSTVWNEYALYDGPDYAEAAQRLHEGLVPAADVAEGLCWEDA